jgi:hypothetical protein
LAAALPAARLGEVHLGQGRVVLAAGGHHHVVGRLGQVSEELLQGGPVGGVEGRGAVRADVGRGLLEVVGIPAGEDDVGARSAGLPAGLQPDAGTAADHHDGLSSQFVYDLSPPAADTAGSRVTAGSGAGMAQP